MYLLLGKSKDDARREVVEEVREKRRQKSFFPFPCSSPCSSLSRLSCACLLTLAVTAITVAATVRLATDTRIPFFTRSPLSLFCSSRHTRCFPQDICCFPDFFLLLFPFSDSLSNSFPLLSPSFPSLPLTLHSFSQRTRV